MIDSDTLSDRRLFGKVWTENELRSAPPLLLAYVGDAVFELYIRGRLAEEGLTKPGKLHNSAIGFVKAQAQAARFAQLEPSLSEHERIIAKRGRNAKSANVPKGASHAEYRWATGFETLVGYLFLAGMTSRLCELLSWSQDESEGEDV